MKSTNSQLHAPPSQIERPNRAESGNASVDQLRLAYEAGVRRGWSAHLKIESVFPDAEFEKWLLKQPAIRA